MIRTGRLRPPPQRLNADEQELVRTNALIGYRMAWQFARTTARDVPVDELISEALYALTYAALIFDPLRGVPFSAFATIVIRHRLIQRVAYWRDRRMNPLPDRSHYSADPWEAEDPRPTPDFCARASASEMCDRLRAELPPRYYQMLRLHFADGHTIQHVAGRFGITRQRARQVLTKAILRARTLLENDQPESSVAA